MAAVSLWCNRFQAGAGSFIMRGVREGMERRGKEEEEGGKGENKNQRE